LCEKHTARLTTLKAEQQLINTQVIAASQRDLDIIELEATLTSTERALKKARTDAATYQSSIGSTTQHVADLMLLIDDLKLKASHAEVSITGYEHIVSELKKSLPIVSTLVRQVDNLQSKIDMLHDHEYNPNCEFCSSNEFVKQAEQAKSEILSVREKKDHQKHLLLDLKLKASTFNIDDLRLQVAEFNSTTAEISRLKKQNEKLELQLQNEQSKIQINEQRRSNALQDITYYNENVEAYENLTSLRRDLQAISKTVSLKASEIKKCDAKVLEFMSEKGSSRRTIEEAQERIAQIRSAERDYIAYDLFVQATHPNGISYEVIKSMLPVINDEIQKILSSIVDFQVFFAEDGDKLEIYLQHPKYDPRPLAMGSGAEKTIASMAVRLALISVSSLPKSQTFILDEPATALDAEHMEGFTRLLQMIKSQFKTVLLITHLESLKDVVDKTIEIDKSDGYAHVNL
jgi:DNA repair protein SbcC/Rad50